MIFTGSIFKTNVKYIAIIIAVVIIIIIIVLMTMITFIDNFSLLSLY